jgi:hypothetical protein
MPSFAVVPVPDNPNHLMKILTSLLIVTAFLAAPAAPQAASISPFKTGATASSHLPFTLKRIASSAVHHGLTGAPRARFWESTSGNWSGYAVPLETSNTKDTFSEVQGTWTVPTVTGSADATYSSLWVGLDGYTSSTVEQTGSESDWTGTGQSNYVWFETYPNYAYEIENFPASPGDTISATVKYIGQETVRTGRRTTRVEDVFQMTITNNSQKVSYTIPTSYTTIASAARSSAEWVMEAPYSGEILPLADFGETGFSNCEAASTHTSGKLAPINTWIPDPLTMIDPDGGSATPSALTSNGHDFTITYTGE